MSAEETLRRMALIEVPSVFEAAPGAVAFRAGVLQGRLDVLESLSMYMEALLAKSNQAGGREYFVSAEAVRAFASDFIERDKAGLIGK